MAGNNSVTASNAEATFMLRLSPPSDVETLCALLAQSQNSRKGAPGTKAEPRQNRDIGRERRAEVSHSVTPPQGPGAGGYGQLLLNMFTSTRDPELLTKSNP